MEYRPCSPETRVKPRLIIHGGAGNITPASLPPEKYGAYRAALLTIVSRTNTYMNTAQANGKLAQPSLPSALETATFAVRLLEDNALFNSGHGAVFTRDGVNELEASVMVSRGRAKRGVGVMGLRRVRNPVLLARAVLERGDADLGAHSREHRGPLSRVPVPSDGDVPPDSPLDVPSAQGHTQVFGAAAEALARRYGLQMVEPAYYFTQQRWDEHVRALEREKQKDGRKSEGDDIVVATWAAYEYLPQGTCGAVALDGHGVVCCATSTGGMTNKLTGRIGDTPVVGAGFWAEEWDEDGDPTRESGWWTRFDRAAGSPAITLSSSLAGLMVDCLPTPFVYSPAAAVERRHAWGSSTTTRSVALSGTGNGDSFLRINAVRIVAAIARFKPLSSAQALAGITGPGGELEKSAGGRWSKTGEGEGGMIGIESVVVRDSTGNIVETRAEILQEYNCGGMFRAWIDDRGAPVVRIWREDVEEKTS